MDTDPDLTRKKPTGLKNRYIVQYQGPSYCGILNVLSDVISKIDANIDLLEGACPDGCGNIVLRFKRSANSQRFPPAGVNFCTTMTSIFKAALQAHFRHLQLDADAIEFNVLTTHVQPTALSRIRFEFIVRVQDEPGMLAAVTSVFERQGMNIDRCSGRDSEALGMVVQDLCKICLVVTFTCGIQDHETLEYLGTMWMAGLQADLEGSADSVRVEEAGFSVTTTPTTDQPGPWDWQKSNSD